MNTIKLFSLVFFLLTSIHEVDETKRLYVQNIRKQPVKCDVLLNGKSIGYTIDGYITLPNCKDTDVIDLIPVNALQYSGKNNINCFQIRDSYVLLEKREMANLKSNAFYLDSLPENFVKNLPADQQRRIYGSVALASNELYSLDFFSDSLREKARINTIKYTAAALDVENGITINLGRAVESPELIEAIGNYQEEKNLPTTLRLDVITISDIGGSNSYEVTTKELNKIVNLEQK